MAKERIDTLLVNKGLVESRNKAQALVMAGKVQVDGMVVTKAGTKIAVDANIVVEAGLPYVGRGGIKLAAALDEFGLDPTGWVCADVGASTGGFTDVLLQRHAAKVYALDVGYGQLAWKLRQDERVIVMERTNVRYVESLPDLIRFAAIDVSFISLKLILPAVKRWLAPSASIVALVKPQFEAGKAQVGKGGVIRDRMVHREVLEKVVGYAHVNQFNLLGLSLSPITGAAGNHEFLIHLGWNVPQSPVDVKMVLEICLAKLAT